MGILARETTDPELAEVLPEKVGIDPKDWEISTMNETLPRQVLRSLCIRSQHQHLIKLSSFYRNYWRKEVDFTQIKEYGVKDTCRQRPLTPVPLELHIEIKIPQLDTHSFASKTLRQLWQQLLTGNPHDSSRICLETGRYYWSPDHNVWVGLWNQTHSKPTFKSNDSQFKKTKNVSLPLLFLYLFFSSFKLCSLFADVFF